MSVKRAKWLHGADEHERVHHWVCMSDEVVARGHQRGMSGVRVCVPQAMRRTSRLPTSKSKKINSKIASVFLYFVQQVWGSSLELQREKMENSPDEKSEKL